MSLVSTHCPGNFLTSALCIGPFSEDDMHDLIARLENTPGPSQELDAEIAEAQAEGDKE